MGTALRRYGPVGRSTSEPKELMSSTNHRTEMKVSFQKPDLERIRQDGIMAVDMHFHTNHSDSPTTIPHALRLAKAKGIGVAITDHNQISGVLEAVEMGVVPVVPGIEVAAADGPHILLYFYDIADLEDFYLKHIKEKKRKSPYLAIRINAEQILHSAGDYHCVRVAAHPYGYLLFNKGLRKSIELDYIDEEIMDSVDGLEVLSGGMSRKQNLKAVRTAEKLDKGMTGGTDGHLLHELGGVVTCSNALDVAGFLDDILSRRNWVVGREKDPLSKGLMGTVVLTKYIRYTVPSLRIHYEQNMPRVVRFIKGGRRKKI